MDAAEYYQRAVLVKGMVDKAPEVRPRLVAILNQHYHEKGYPQTSPWRIDGRAEEPEGCHHAIYRLSEFSFADGRVVYGAIKTPLTAQEYGGGYQFEPGHSHRTGRFVQAQLGAFEAQLERREHGVPYFTIAVLWEGLLSLLTEDLTEGGACS